MIFLLVLSVSSSLSGEGLEGGREGGREWVTGLFGLFLLVSPSLLLCQERDGLDGVGSGLPAFLASSCWCCRSLLLCQERDGLDGVGSGLNSNRHLNTIQRTAATACLNANADISANRGGEGEQTDSFFDEEEESGLLALGALLLLRRLSI
jgi:hypothetical protein